MQDDEKLKLRDSVMAIAEEYKKSAQGLIDSMSKEKMTKEDFRSVSENIMFLSSGVPDYVFKAIVERLAYDSLDFSESKEKLIEMTSYGITGFKDAKNRSSDLSNRVLKTLSDKKDS